MTRPTRNLPSAPPGFKYTRSSETDISKTFARIRKQLEKEPAKPINVKPIKRSA